MSIKKCGHLTYIQGRRVFQKEQLKYVGRLEVKDTNTELYEMKEMHD
jgi:hypothetical protein